MTEYVPIASKEASEIVDNHWLKDSKGALRYIISSNVEFEFLYNMKRAQIKLIEMHYHSMSHEDKVRAVKTLKILQAI